MAASLLGVRGFWRQIRRHRLSHLRIGWLVFSWFLASESFDIELGKKRSGAMIEEVNMRLANLKRVRYHTTLLLGPLKNLYLLLFELL